MMIDREYFFFYPLVPQGKIDRGRKRRGQKHGQAKGKLIYSPFSRKKENIDRKKCVDRVGSQIPKI